MQIESTTQDPSYNFRVRERSDRFREVARSQPMPDKPSLLFLHGVGTGDLEDTWRVALDNTLTGIGYPASAASR